MCPIEMVCPKDHQRLAPCEARWLVCPAGHRYPTLDDVPVLLATDTHDTIALAQASRARATDGTCAKADELFLESLGVSEEEKRRAQELARDASRSIDPAVSVLLGATCGFAYKHLIGNAKEYPIPEIELPNGEGKRLLDIGCSWGRWSIAAARKGYRVVGIDPSLGAIMAARRVARQLGLAIDYLVGDARLLPFPNESFDVVYSYSVLQHFGYADAEQAIREIGRILERGGTAKIQMAHRFGVRSFYHQWRRRFREARDFEVRYWSVPRLRKTFAKLIGPSRVDVHCFFGLGLESSDIPRMYPTAAFLTRLSGGLRWLSRGLPMMRHMADSVYVTAQRRQASGIAARSVQANCS